MPVDHQGALHAQTPTCSHMQNMSCILYYHYYYYKRHNTVYINPHKLKISGVIAHPCYTLLHTSKLLPLIPYTRDAVIVVTYDMS